MEYDSKNVLHSLHLDGTSHDIYQGFLKEFFDYFVKLIASFPPNVFSQRGAKNW